MNTSPIFTLLIHLLLLAICLVGWSAVLRAL
jgi:hypothetical protein